MLRNKKSAKHKLRNICKMEEIVFMNRERLIKLTKYILDVMFFGGIAITASLPFSIKFLGNYIDNFQEYYEATVIIYFVLGIAAVIIIRELRRIFRTVLNKNCFVRDNVVSLDKMCKWSFFIVLMSVVRNIVFLTSAMSVVILVFIIAGLFSKVLSYVFEQAIEYKEENDFTILSQSTKNT